MPKIVQISGVYAPTEGHSIWGLGEDNQIYAWNWKLGAWQLHSEAGAKARAVKPVKKPK